MSALHLGDHLSLYPCFWKKWHAQMRPDQSPPAAGPSGRTPEGGRRTNQPHSQHAAMRRCGYSSKRQSSSAIRRCFIQATRPPTTTARRHVGVAYAPKAINRIALAKRSEQRLHHLLSPAADAPPTVRYRVHEATLPSHVECHQPFA